MHVLRFGVENFRCFRDYTEVSFISTAQQDAPDFRIPSEHAPHGLLPVLGVYGANAAGKSNLLAAVHALRDHVLHSFTARPDRPVPWQPWRMRLGESDPLSQLDLDFELDGTRYHYGFRYSKRGFAEEWLHRWPANRKQVLFERDHGEAEPWYFGPNLSGDKVRLARATRANSLFLSTAAHNNHEDLSKVYDAIVAGLQRETRIELSGYPLFLEGSPILDPAIRPTIESVLRAFDLGCVGVELVEKPVESLGPPTALQELFRAEALEAVQEALAKQGSVYEVKLLRQSEDGTRWTLPCEMESRGTNILLQRINDLLALESGLLVIDELETSLHPDVCAALVGLFTSRDVNGPGVQLLFSTHDRGLLQQLRRDEALIVEKHAEGEATVHSAADYRELRARDDLRAAHEAGRLGGVPVLGPLDLRLGS